MPEKTAGGKILFSLRKICDIVNIYVQIILESGNTEEFGMMFAQTPGRRTDEGLSETTRNKTDIYH